MAKRHYIADSAFLLPSSLLCVRSNVTGGWAVMPDVGPMAGGISLFTATS